MYRPLFNRPFDTKRTTEDKLHEWAIRDKIIFRDEERKLKTSINYAGILILLFTVLSVFGVIHWAIWVPGLFACIGIALSGAMQLNRIDEIRSERLKEGDYIGAGSGD